MTYERPEVIMSTIHKIFSQSLPPERLVIVDNSESTATQLLCEQVKDARVEYYRVGYNSGPAGAARIGLQKLVDEGYEWILWGDDDNPPQFDPILSVLVEQGELLRKNGVKVGAVGVSGSLFNKWTGRLLRIDTDKLNTMNEVITIPGNAKFIIHADVVKEGILPHEELFFGFEELEYAFQMNRKGFRLFCHGPLLVKHRNLFNRLGKVGNKIEHQKEYQLKRRYYSYRNLLYIMMFRQKWYWTSCALLLRWLIRTAYDLRFGKKYFVKSLIIFGSSVSDALNKRMGMKSSLIKAK